jgi:hypothetical protein
MIEHKLDVSKFFREGYFETRVASTYWINEIKAQMDREAFEDRIPNPDKPMGRYDEVYQLQKPSWDQGRPSNEAPEVYNRFFDAVASDPSFAWFHGVLGPFSHKTIMTTRIRKSGGIGFHHDVKESTAIIVLLYLTDSTFSLEDGGFLEMARVGRLKPTAMPDSEMIPFGSPIVPQEGKLVFLNNFDPTFVHRVSQIVSEKSRFTVSCQLGWLSNVSHIWNNTKVYRDQNQND